MIQNSQNPSPSQMPQKNLKAQASQPCSQNPRSKDRALQTLEENQKLLNAVNDLLGAAPQEEPSPPMPIDVPTSRKAQEQTQIPSPEMTRVPVQIQLRAPRIIAIEGLDGTGKESVAKAVLRMANEAGIEAQMISFPRYGTPTGNLCEAHQRGAFGDPTQQDPFLVASLYTWDRLDWFRSNEFYQNLQGSQLLILDRSYYSNFIYQAMKCRSTKTLAQWMYLNYRAECVQAMKKWRECFFEVYYLQLSSQDCQAQITSRTNQDIYEINRSYQTQCDAFVQMSQNQIFVNSLMDELNALDRSSVARSIWNAYIHRVKIIPVVHAKCSEDIPLAIETNAQKIFNQAVRSPHIPPEDYDYLPDVISNASTKLIGGW